jgi:hypothetical protein
MAYRLAKITRAFGLDKLRETDELDIARRSHAGHFLRVAELVAVERERIPQRDWLSRHVAQANDILEALIWALNAPEEGQLAVKLAVAALPFFSHSPLAAPWLGALRRVLEDRYAPYRSVADELKIHIAYAESHAAGASEISMQALLTQTLERAVRVGDMGSQLECMRMLSNATPLSNETVLAPWPTDSTHGRAQ